MKEKLLSILKDYQREFVTSESKVTIGNFSRRGGKSTVEIFKVLYDRPRYSYFVTTFNFRASLSYIFKEAMNLLDYNGIRCIERFTINEDYALIEYTDGTFSKIFNYHKKDSFNFHGYRLPEVMDMVIYDECLPLSDIKCKQAISTVTLRGISGRYYHNSSDVKVITCGLSTLVKNEMFEKEGIDRIRLACGDKLFRNEIDIEEEYEMIFGEIEIEKTVDKTIDEQIKETLKELETIPKNRNTTDYRRQLITIIRDLKQLKKVD